MNPALSFENLSQRYGRLEALHGLNLTVPRGSLYALLEPNGAALMARFFPDAADTSVTPLSLRSIFIALARQSAGTDSREV
jgi:hypothetical protein